MASQNKILLYDDYCPLCSWYSGLFVKYGLLDKKNRVGFSTADPSLLTAIDIERGKDEIPLLDLQTGQALYGIEALLDILGAKSRLIKKAGEWRPVNWLLKKLYKFISYNRKVIVARKCGKGVYDCSPAFDPFYRVLFMVFFFVFNSVMLYPLHLYLLNGLSFYRLSFIQLETSHLLFVFINCMLAMGLRSKKGIEYLGQVNMLAVLSVLFLTGFLFLDRIFLLPEWSVVGFLCSLSFFIIREYFRRMRYALINGNKTIVTTNLVCLAAFLVYVFH
jgi:predicted DCC family thiol-disulfide oxidoreductase YuxK